MIEVQDIFRLYGDLYRRVDGKIMSPQQHKAMRHIASCRTAAMGGHVDRCDTCGHERISYNSCRDRHCPKCQFLKKEKWLEDRRRAITQQEKVAELERGFSLSGTGHGSVIPREISFVVQKRISMWFYYD